MKDIVELVLILIILEVLYEKSCCWKDCKTACLNPYYTGSTLWDPFFLLILRQVIWCLNPYYTGSTLWDELSMRTLSLQDEGLNPYYTGSTLWVSTIIPFIWKK